MTDAAFESPRLERPAHAPFRGVCAALGRTTGTDPRLWRVLTIVLTFFGGLGAVLYAVGVAIIAEEGRSQSLLQRLVHGPDRRLRGGDVLLLVLLAVGLGALVTEADGAVAVVVLAGLAVMWARGRDGERSSPVGAVRVAGEHSVVARPRSPLTAVTASLAALVAVALALLGAYGPYSVPAEVVVAAALLAVGLGLVASSWWGSSRWLVLLAVLLGLSLAGLAAARPVTQAGVGTELWQPTAAGSYQLGMGEATLDLRQLPVRSGAVAVDARVAAGTLVVLVPDGLRVAVHARVGVGELEVLGSSTSGRGQQRAVELGPVGAPQVRVEASVGTGEVQVRRG